MIESAVPKEFKELAKLQTKVEDDLLARRNVVGVALGHKQTKGEFTKQQTLTVLVESKLDLELLRPEDVVPTTFDGVKTDVLEVGVVHARAATLTPPLVTTELPELEFGPTDGVVTAPPVPAFEQAVAEEVRALQLIGRVRPAMGGYSVGHYKITAGTIATGCIDRVDFGRIPSHFYLLSNNHVLANSNLANIGDPILQPGPYDGGTVAGDTIAKLARFVPIRFAAGTSYPLNYVDAAIGEVNFHDLSREVFYIGYPAPVVAATMNEQVMKTGRTTSFSMGHVIGLNATVDVNYGGGRVARFAQQVITQTSDGKAMCAGGDSGSLVLDLKTGGVVGLLFAGSDRITIVNRIDYVQALLGIAIIV